MGWDTTTSSLVKVVSSPASARGAIPNSECESCGRTWANRAFGGKVAMGRLPLAEERMMEPSAWHTLIVGRRSSAALALEGSDSDRTAESSGVIKIPVAPESANAVGCVYCTCGVEAVCNAKSVTLQVSVKDETTVLATLAKCGRLLLPLPPIRQALPPILFIAVAAA